MERERKGRPRAEHGVQPLLAKLGLVRVAKTGEAKVAWREFGIIGLLVALLTVLLLPRLQVQMRPLAEGDVAPADIKAHADLLIEDEAATQQKRREAADRVLPVYDVDGQALAAIEGRLAQALGIIDAAYQVRAPALTAVLGAGGAAALTPEDRARVKGLEGAAVALPPELIMASPLFAEREREFQRALGLELGQETLAALRRLRYDPRLRDGVLKVLAPVFQRGIVSDKGFVAAHRATGVVLREVPSGQERVIADVSTLFDLHEATESAMLAALTLDAAYPPTLLQAIAAVAPKLLHANVTFNAEATEERRKQAIAAVKPVYFQVKRGEMIIREGERVRGEHLPKLRALAAGKRKGDPFSSVAGTAIFSALVVAFGLLYLRHLQPKLPWDSRALLLLGVLLVGNLLVARLFLVLAQALVESFPVVEAGLITYALPVAAGGMLVAIFFDFHVGILYAIMSSLLLGVMLRDNLAMAVLALVGNLIATFRVNQYRQRSSILLTGLYIGLANVLTLMAFALMSSNLFAPQRAWEGLFGLLGGLLAAVVVSAVLPLLESLFKVTTDIKLLELASLDHPLLRQLVVHAPGTYHHSMLVGALAEAAAEAIGANALLARVGSYYHDIGKMLTPEYFIENQMGRENKHDRLSPSMSALIIAAHVKDGVKLAREYKLPQRIIDIIPQHHGTNLISYFYNKAKELEDPAVQQVQEADYRYPGPKPQTREAAIVMLADKVEAASRSLTDPTPQRIKGLVQRIVNSVFTDGQLDECDLTLRDLQRIIDAFVRTLIAIYHHRIAYPTVESEEMRRRNRHAHAPQFTEPTKEHPDRHPGAQQDPPDAPRRPRLSEL
jgi:putative nucleotidyltransferase with HDIG domain